MGSPLVLSCLEADFDAATGQCAAPFYSYQSTAWPVLSLDDAALIGASIAYLLAIAFVFNRLRKFLDQL